ncbi:ADP-ribosylglycohydrolase family protein [Armatimonas sp.]|uniref:ADP-ribosylglycohydrolase family protein n=1 Tax=Armatimonas sp. TaxID=1872638 RepID=UPI003753E721
MSSLPTDYEERVYAGVLGKIIGVYLGRPFEGWTNARIEKELGEVWYYVHDKLGKPLIVTDDDISGTFTFPRAFPDNNNAYDITPEQVGKTWLNYLIENRTVLWWGGMGVSTEHTAYLRLKHGVVPPASGSAEMNGQVVAEQIGSQIFIDGWAMLCPGDPDKAAALAQKAASVSHDGEAIYGAQVIAALEALAFTESDLGLLLDQAVTYIPRASVIWKLIHDMRAWHEEEPRNWRATLRKIEETYGYDTFGGGCHLVPNHAVILLALLYGDDDFQKSLMIANTAGWDTDCNSGNVGCLLGIKNGLAGLSRGADFRTPVADRLYIPTADGGRAITDAATVTYELVNSARAMQGLRPLAPNNGMQYHFALPGSLQGFITEDSPESAGTTRLENVVLGALAEGAGVAADERALKLSYTGVAQGRTARAATATFTPPDALNLPGYSLIASPRLYPGQTVRARVVADDTNARLALIRLYVRYYGKDDQLETLGGPLTQLASGEFANLTWQLPDMGGCPIAEVGIKVGGHSGEGAIYLDWLGWSGIPETVLGASQGKAAQHTWVNAADHFWVRGGDFPFRIVQNEGTGYVFQGCHEWSEYSVHTEVQAHLADTVGLVAAVRGLRRHVALVLSPDGAARLVWTHDDQRVVLSDASIAWQYDHPYRLVMSVHSDGRITASVEDGDSVQLLEGNIPAEQAHGAIGLLTTVGNASFGPVGIEPV